eukprot:s2356_g23.t1
MHTNPLWAISEVLAEVLRVAEPAHVLLRKCALALQSFEKQLGTDKLTACCKLYAAFKELVSQYGRLKEPSWTVHIMDAGRRFFQIIEGDVGSDLALSFCKSHEPKECMQKLNSLGASPPTFASYKDVVGAFEAWNAIEGEPPSSDDHTEVIKHLANLVTFLSLDVKVVMALYPECHKKVDAYQSQVVANITRTMNKMKVELTDAQKTLETFRQSIGQGLEKHCRQGDCFVNNVELESECLHTLRLSS